MASPSPRSGHTASALPEAQLPQERTQTRSDERGALQSPYGCLFFERLQNNAVSPSVIAIETRTPAAQKTSRDGPSLRVPCFYEAHSSHHPLCPAGSSPPPRLHNLPLAARLRRRLFCPAPPPRCPRRGPPGFLGPPSGRPP